jgi:beta-glucanase (GH16 family)
VSGNHGAARPRRRARWVAGAGAAAVLALAAALSAEHFGRVPSAGPRPGTGAAASPVAPSMRLTPSAAAQAPAAPSGSVSPPAPPGPWRLVFADDFGGGTLDGGRWVTCYDWNQGGCTNASNHELQWYTPGQVAVTGGAAVLTAARRGTVGLAGRRYPWTSGMLSTGRPYWTAAPRFTFCYGYLEARIKMPSAAGMFPAFWMLAADESGSPEVDVVEQIGNHTSAFMNLHWRTASGIGVQDPATYGPEDFSAGYHDFAVDWEPGRITWYIDGVSRYRVDNRSMVPAVPIEVVFTLAVGFPDPPPVGVSTGAMSIDRVRVWQH